MSLLDKVSTFFDGAKGRLFRVALSTAAGWAAARYANNQLYISLTPLLSYVGKLLRDKYPGSWDWLPV